jgi:hypothetical protein
LAGASWSLPGEVGFYLPDHPQVYSLGPVLGDRRSQYDLWRPNPISDAERFIGRTFIVIGAGSELAAEFGSVQCREVTHYESGQPVARWTISICRAYKGLARAPGMPGSF